MTTGIMLCNGIVEERRRYNGSIPCRENKGLYDNEQSPSAQYGVVLKGKGASFDCSGYVSWVINNCGVGWNFGRLTADGLLGVCTPVSSADAKPGDLIFFQGTYNTSGASHVGIYVGNGMMIHCGDPISYANINTSYRMAATPVKEAAFQQADHTAPKQPHRSEVSL